MGIKKLCLIKTDFSVLLKNKLICFVFVTSMLILSILFTFLYGNSVTYIATRNKKSNIGFRRYECSVVNNDIYLTDSLIQQIENIFAEYPIDDIFFESQLIMTSAKNSPQSYGAWKSGQESLSQEQITSADNVIFVSDRIDANEHRILRREGNTAYYGYRPGQEYKIIGEFYSPVGETIGYIPYTSFIDGKYDITQICVIASRRLNSIENDSIIESFNNLPFNIEYNSFYPSAFKDEEMTKSMGMIILLSLIYIMALFSYLYMLKCIIDKNKYYYGTNILFGAKRNNLATRFFVELMVFIGAINLLGIFIHYILYDSIFEKINLITNIVYYTNDYIVIMSLLTCLTILLVLPYSVYFSKCGITNLYRKGD